MGSTEKAKQRTKCRQNGGKMAEIFKRKPWRSCGGNKAEIEVHDKSGRELTRIELRSADGKIHI